jgi:hypothetical protein
MLGNGAECVEYICAGAQSHTAQEMREFAMQRLRGGRNADR